jgi:tRNA threonylcarbamoyladenosine biosynthesis protein TsaB
VSLEALLAELRSPSLICGEFTEEIRQKIMSNENARLVSAANSIRRPAVLAELAWARWGRGEVDDEASLAPVYLHTAEPIPS